MSTERTFAQDVAARWDEVFRAVSVEPRRQLIAALMDAPPDGQVDLPAAAESPLISADRERLSIQLRHNHLPLLEDLGFVRWSNDPFHAERGPDFDEVAIVLESLYDNASRIPDGLVNGCRRLESERRKNHS